ncbi:MAG: hypothetical protein E6885_04760 [Dermabacter sp.]|nr:hypothetical protein [Dermabacter sp.]
MPLKAARARVADVKDAMCALDPNAKKAPAYITFDRGTTGKIIVPRT